MTGRLGYPNAGRLTTSAMLKSSNNLAAAAHEAFFRIPYKSAILGDRVDIDETEAIQWFLGQVLSESVQIAEPVVTLLVTYFDSLADSIAVADALARPVLAVPLSEVISVLESYNVASFASLSDQFRATSGLQAVRAHIVTHQDTVGVAEVLLTAPAKVVRDAVAILETAAPGWRAGVVLADTTRLTSQLLGAWAALMQDSVQLGEAISIVRGLAIAEQFGIQLSQSAVARYGMTFSDALRLRDSLGRFFGAEAIDSLTVAPALLAVARGSASMADTVAIAETTTPQFYLRVTLTDEVEIADDEVLQAIYSGRLADAIEVAAAYLSPGGEFTTWVMNTRTAAVTEYDGYDFNSFAAIGKKYIGATSQGLYELNGDTDDGDDVIATIAGGFMQFGATKLSRLKAAYIAMRGTGQIFLKIETGEGVEYIYQITTENMHTTKIPMGKGQRARYFAYELTTTGQDFDLDTLEFVPIIMKRRV